MTGTTAQVKRGRVVLGIETATPYGSVAVHSPAGLLGEVTQRSSESHSERILAAVQGLLLTLDLPLRDVAAVAVSCGPGSFTGLRAGIAAAKGLAFSLGIPLFSVPTLEVLAANAMSGDAPIAAILPARRGEVFYGLFRHRGTRLEPLREEGIIPITDLASTLPRGCVVVGDSSALSDPETSRRFFITPRHLSYPRAAVVASQGLEHVLSRRTSELETLHPRYLRPPDAERGDRPRFE